MFYVDASYILCQHADIIAYKVLLTVLKHYVWYTSVMKKHCWVAHAMRLGCNKMYIALKYICLMYYSLNNHPVLWWLSCYLIFTILYFLRTLKYIIIYRLLVVILWNNTCWWIYWSQISPVRCYPILKWYILCMTLSKAQGQTLHLPILPINFIDIVSVDIFKVSCVYLA